MRNKVSRECAFVTYVIFLFRSRWKLLPLPYIFYFFLFFYSSSSRSGVNEVYLLYNQQNKGRLNIYKLVIWLMKWAVCSESPIFLQQQPATSNNFYLNCVQSLQFVVCIQVLECSRFSCVICSLAIGLSTVG